MKEKGFTLTEIIAVLAVLGLLLAIALPQVLSQFRSQQEGMSEKQKDLIIESTRLYVEDNALNVPGAEGCRFTFDTLVALDVLNQGFLDSVTFGGEYFVLVRHNSNVYTVTIENDNPPPPCT